MCIDASTPIHRPSLPLVLVVSTDSWIGSMTHRCRPNQTSSASIYVCTFSSFFNSSSEQVDEKSCIYPQVLLTSLRGLHGRGRGTLSDRAQDWDFGAFSTPGFHRVILVGTLVNPTLSCSASFPYPLSMQPLCHFSSPISLDASR